MKHIRCYWKENNFVHLFFQNFTHTSMISTFYINEDWRKFQKDIVLIMIIERVIEKKNYFHLFTKILIVVLPKFNFYSNWNLMYHGKRNTEQEVKNLMVIRSAISVPYKNFRLFFFKYVWIYPLNSIQLDNSPIFMLPSEWV